MIPEDLDLSFFMISILRLYQTQGLILVFASVIDVTWYSKEKVVKKNDFKLPKF